jgi:hypothetical protein
MITPNDIIQADIIIQPDGRGYVIMLACWLVFFGNNIKIILEGRNFLIIESRPGGGGCLTSGLAMQFEIIFHTFDHFL